MKDTVYLLALNNQTNIIVRAAEIEAGLWTKENKPTFLTKKVRKSSWPTELRDETMELDGKEYDCPVMAINMYNIDRPLLIMLPNGKTEWVSESGSYV